MQFIRFLQILFLSVLLAACSSSGSSDSSNGQSAENGSLSFVLDWQTSTPEMQETASVAESAPPYPYVCILVTAAGMESITVYLDSDVTHAIIPAVPLNKELNGLIQRFNESGTVIYEATFVSTVQETDNDIGTVTMERVDNATPIADAGDNRRVLLNSVVTLDGSGSYDADGDSLEYFWMVMEQPDGSSLKLSDPNATTQLFTATHVGRYVLGLSVGDGSTGSLFDNVIIYILTPGDSLIRSAWAFGGTSYAIATTGRLWWWGASVIDPVTYKPVLPVQVDGNNNWKKVVGGSHTIGLKDDGTLWAWGFNDWGNLGVDTNNYFEPLPVQIGKDSDWIEVASRGYFSHAIKSDGSLWGWGYNEHGELGDGTLTMRRQPVQIGTDTDWSKVSSCNDHALAIKTDGSLWAWGVNSGYKLGDGTNVNRLSPVQIGTDTDWSQISTGTASSLALKSDGSLWGWGAGSNGQLGDGTGERYTVPTRIGSINDWLQIEISGTSTTALKTDGTIWSWGWNYYGTFGNGTTNWGSYSPVQCGSDTDWSHIVNSGDYVMAVKSDGTLWTWGNNMSGQLGDGTNTERFVPGNVVFYNSITASTDYTAEENIPPVAAAGDDQFVTTVTATVLDGSQSSDYENAPLSYDWTVVSVPDGAVVQPLSATAKPQFIGSLAGTYVVELVVNDGMADSAPVQVVVSVQPPEVGALFDSGKGTGEYDFMTYYHYYSDVIFNPYADMSVTAIDPYVGYCNGECYYDVEIYDDSDLLLESLSLTGSDLADFYGTFSSAISLSANQSYRIYEHAWTTKSVGIWTAGGASPKASQTGEYSVISADSNSANHLDRGPIAFKLIGY